MSLTKANTRMLEGNLPISQVPEIPNTKLANDSITINGSAVALGGSTTIATGGGKIGQVVSMTLSSSSQTTSSAFGDISGFNLSITPSATSSTIFVQAQIAAEVSNGGGGSTFGALKLLRGSSSLEQIDSFVKLGIGNGEADNLTVSSYHSFIDSPNSTSEVTFKYQFFCTNGFFKVRAGSKITLMEVLA